MYRKIYIFFLLTLFANSAISNTISGTFKPFAGSKIYASICDDFITETPIYIGQTTADNNGNFTLKIQNKGTKKVWIKTIQYIFSIYIVDTNSYRIELHEPVNAQSLENKKFLVAKVLSESPSVNKNIKMVDSIFDKFYTDNYLKFIHPRSIKLAADTLRKKLEAITSNSSMFEKAYAHYAFATIDDASGMREKYFYHQYTSNILSAENLESYYKFIKEHYKSYFEKTIAKPCFGEATSSINEQHNCASILDKIAACDTLIRNDSLRELLFCAGLQSLYYKREYKKTSIEMMLRFMAFNSKYNSVKKTCKNILSKVTALNIGNTAPNFKLTSSKGDSISLSEQKGKLVYLCFVSYGNLEWQTHIPIIERLQLLYDKRLQVITITLSNDIQQLKALQNSKSLSGIVLDAHEDFFIRNDYLIDQIPKYVLIDDEGDILKTTNCSPTDNIEELIKASLKKK